MQSGVLIERYSVQEVGSAYKIAATPAMVPSKVPCEGRLAHGAT